MPEADPEALGRGQTLVRIARRSLERAFAGAAASDDEESGGEAWLRAPGASFVTLRQGGELRGCVGSAVATRPLGEDVWRNARAAAFRDVRFPSLGAAELPRTTIDVTVLSPLEPVPAASEAELLAALRPRIDGLVLELDAHRGLFLPVVWEHLPQPREFVAALKRKAGLEPDFWSPRMELSRFTATEWREEDLLAVSALPDRAASP